MTTETFPSDPDAVTPWRRDHADRLPLTCPYCSSPVSVDARVDHRFDIEITIECDRVECGAQWDVRGQSEKTPAQFQTEIDQMIARHVR